MMANYNCGLWALPLPVGAGDAGGGAGEPHGRGMKPLAAPWPGRLRLWPWPSGRPMPRVGSAGQKMSPAARRAEPVPAPARGVTRMRHRRADARGEAGRALAHLPTAGAGLGGRKPGARRKPGAPLTAPTA